MDTQPDITQVGIYYRVGGQKLKVDSGRGKALSCLIAYGENPVGLDKIEWATGWATPDNQMRYLANFINSFSKHYHVSHIGREYFLTTKEKAQSQDREMLKVVRSHLRRVIPTD